LIGTTEKTVFDVDQQEVAACKWVELTFLQHDLTQNPAKYTPWFKIIIDKFF
jgi:isopentenyldiphosphate isomerase